MSRRRRRSSSSSRRRKRNRSSGSDGGLALSHLSSLRGKDARAITLATGSQGYAIAVAVLGLLLTGCTHEKVTALVNIAVLWYVNPDLADPTRHPDECTIASIFQPSGRRFGLALSHVSGIDGKDARAIALETSIQNEAIAMAILDLIFAGCAHEEATAFVKIAVLWHAIKSVLWVGAYHLILICRGRPLAINDPQSRAPDAVA